MTDEIPDSLDDTPLHPQTVEGKIHEMRDIGLELLDSTDELGKSLQLARAHYATLQRAKGGCPITVRGEDVWLQTLTTHLLKLTTLCQLQTDTITQLYGELRGPGW